MKKVILAVDVGAIGIKASLVNLGLVVVADLGRVLTEADKGPQQAVEKVIGLLRANRDLIGAYEIVGWGGNIPGPAYYERGVMLSSPQLPSWKGFKFVQAMNQRLSEELGYRVCGAVTNDVAAAAYGEFLCGVGGGEKSVLLAAVGGGVGGGYADKKVGLFTGSRHVNQSHIGHQYVIGPLEAEKGRLCGCEERGHAEAYCSFTAMAAMVSEALASGVESSLREVWEVAPA